MSVQMDKLPPLMVKGFSVSEENMYKIVNYAVIIISTRIIIRSLST